MPVFGSSARHTIATSHWPASIAMQANEIMLMLVAPPWSHTPPTFGCIRIASASVCPYIDEYFEVGTFTNSASTDGLVDAGIRKRVAARFDIHRHRAAARQAPELRVADAGDDVLAAHQITPSFASRSTSPFDSPSQPESTSSLLAPSVLLGSCGSGGAPS